MFLLDTHTWLWWMAGSERIGPETRTLIDRQNVAVWISAAAAWEIAIKVGLGRLELDESPDVCLPRELERSGFQELPIRLAHAAAVSRLPPYHRDPFDRVQIAQAQMEGLTIMTTDPKIRKYDVPTRDPSL